jgi:spore maturation protein CgeB
MESFMRKKILFISSLYPEIIQNIYRENRDLSNYSYDKQYQTIIQMTHSWSDCLMQKMKDFDSVNIFPFIAKLQNKWQEENSIKSSTVYELIIKQILFYKPDILFFESAVEFSSDFYSSIKKLCPSVKYITGHCCCKFTKDNIKSFQIFDLLFTSSPQYESAFKENKIKTSLVYHCFDSTMIKQDIIYPFSNRRNLIFTGTLNNHVFIDRVTILNHLLKNNVKIDIFTSIPRKIDLFKYYIKKILFLIVNKIKNILPIKIFKNLSEKYANLYPIKLPLKIVKNSKKAIFSNQMIEEIANSKICLNIHGGPLKNYAANIRLFEATGAGSCLLTEHMENLNDLFEIDKEIVTFHNENDCLNKISWLLKNPEICEKIAKAGQKKTLEYHTFTNRVSIYENEMKKMIINSNEI